MWQHLNLVVVDILCIYLGHLVTCLCISWIYYSSMGGFIKDGLRICWLYAIFFICACVLAVDCNSMHVLSWKGWRQPKALARCYLDVIRDSVQEGSHCCTEDQAEGGGVTLQTISVSSSLMPKSFVFLLLVEFVSRFWVAWETNAHWIGSAATNNFELCLCGLLANLAQLVSLCTFFPCVSLAKDAWILSRGSCPRYLSYLSWLQPYLTINISFLQKPMALFFWSSKFGQLGVLCLCCKLCDLFLEVLTHSVKTSLHLWPERNSTIVVNVWWVFAAQNCWWLTSDVVAWILCSMFLKLRRKGCCLVSGWCLPHWDLISMFTTLTNHLGQP